MKRLTQVAIVVNKSKPEAESTCGRILLLLKAVGVQVSVTSDFPLQKDFLKDHDACICIGGDGTILSAVTESVTHQVPLLGINTGKLGFLALYSVESFIESLSTLLKGDYELANRRVLACSSKNETDHDKPTEIIALNDIVIKQMNQSRLITIQVSHDDHLVNNYHCDGLIFATGTGSTAYNLSAGGPIISPEAHTFAMTPICPHTLTNRSVLFGQDSCLKIDSLSPHDEPTVFFDGQQKLSGSGIFPLSIQLSQRTLPLILPHDYSYFQVLRTKLKW